MARVLGHEPCPKCRALGKDNHGDNLVVYDNNHEHCFACHYHSFPKYHVPHQIKLEPHVNKALLPLDFSGEIPGHAWKWLLQYGLSYKYWQECVGYSEKEQRLIFRVGDTEIRGGVLQKSHTSLAFSLGRLCKRPDEHQDNTDNYRKQSNENDSLQQRWGDSVHRIKRDKKWYVYGDSSKHVECLNPNQGPSIILVEDLISAHKVAQITTAIPLFGTQIHAPIIYYLLNDPRPVKIWLDKDQEGNVKRTAVRVSSLVNKPIDIIVTNDDPKLQSFDTITKLI